MIDTGTDTTTGRHTDIDIQIHRHGHRHMHRQSDGPRAQGVLDSHVGLVLRAC